MKTIQFNIPILVLIIIFHFNSILYSQETNRSSETDSVALLPLDFPNNEKQKVFTEPGDNNTNINYTRLYLMSGTLVGIATAVQIYQYNAWWKDSGRSFHFREDLEYGKSVDKVGHVWGAAFTSFIFSNSFEWIGINKHDAKLYGSIGGTIFELFIEFQDGFSQWGFDRVDAVADIVGGFYPYLQHQFPVMDNFNIKASYYPRKLGESKGGYLAGQKYILVDDYEGQTFWVTAKIGKMIFKDIKHLHPFGLALGYSARNIHSPKDQYGIFILSLDFDFKEVIPQNTWFLKTLSEGLNYIKIPAPAIQLSPKFIGLGLYF